MTQTTILCVDDDPVFCDLYRNILEPEGFNFMSANDPAAGLKAVVTAKPDLILLDVMMPERKGVRDGFGLLEELRKNPDLKRVPIIMVSALGDEDDVRHGIDIGAADYLPKQHLTPKKLLAAVKKFLPKKE